MIFFSLICALLAVLAMAIAGVIWVHREIDRQAARGESDVAQAGSLPYRRLSTGGASVTP